MKSWGPIQISHIGMSNMNVKVSAVTDRCHQMGSVKQTLKKPGVFTSCGAARHLLLLLTGAAAGKWERRLIGSSMCVLWQGDPGSWPQDKETSNVVSSGIHAPWLREMQVLRSCDKPGRSVGRGASALLCTNTNSVCTIQIKFAKFNKRILNCLTLCYDHL